MRETYRRRTCRALAQRAKAGAELREDYSEGLHRILITYSSRGFETPDAESIGEIVPATSRPGNRILGRTYPRKFQPCRTLRGAALCFPPEGRGIRPLAPDLAAAHRQSTGAIPCVAFRIVAAWMSRWRLAQGRHPEADQVTRPKDFSCKP